MRFNLFASTNQKSTNSNVSICLNKSHKKTIKSAANLGTSFFFITLKRKQTKIFSIVKSISLFPSYFDMKRNLQNVHNCGLLRNSESHLSKLPPNAKCSVRWKRDLQKLIMVSEKHPCTKKYLHSRAAVAFEKRRHGKSVNWWVIHPYSNFRFFWDFLMTIVFLYWFTVAAYIIGFQIFFENYSLIKNSYILMPGYIICSIDIIINYLTGFLSAGGQEMILDPILIAKHYSRGYFSMDLISSIPWLLIFYDKYPSPETRNSWSFILLQVFPLLKFVRLLTLRNYVKQLNAEENGYLFINILQTNSTLLSYVSSLHIGASYLFASNFIENKNAAVIFDCLRSSLLILGTTYYLYIIVILLQLVKSFADPELKYQEIVHEVNEYIRDRKPPKKLSKRLLNYYEYRFQGSFFHEKTITSTLSSHLKHEILVNSSRSLLETSSLFHNLPRALLGEIFATLKQDIYLEDDVIFQCEADGDCMYFIVNGTVAIISFSGKEICHLEDGNHFGELSLIFPKHKRHVSVIALELCELLRFERKDFKQLVSQKSELYMRLTSLAQTRLKMISKFNEEAKLLKMNLRN